MSFHIQIIDLEECVAAKFESWHRFANSFQRSEQIYMRGKEKKLVSRDWVKEEIGEVGGGCVCGGRHRKKEVQARTKLRFKAEEKYQTKYK